MQLLFSNVCHLISSCFTGLHGDGGYLPTRFVISFLLFWALCLEYAHRVCLSVTIVAMINHTALAQLDNGFTDDTCTVPTGINVTLPEEDGNYLWSPSAQGVILGSYFCGFVCTQIIGGSVTELMSGKWLFGLSILTTSFLTLGTPAAAELGVISIVGVRVLMGLIHGICMPTAFALLSHWAPEEEERRALVAVCAIGDQLGTVLSMPLTGYLCEYGFAGGWPSVYYILGTLGCIWFVFWTCFVCSHPLEHPNISKFDIIYIQNAHIQISEEQEIPWKKVLRCKAVWTVSVVSFCGTWGYTTLLTKLPTYLQVVLHVPIQKNGLVNSLIYVSSCLTLFLSVFISDYLRSKKYASSTNVRKAFESFALMGPAVFTALIPFVKCDRIMVVTLLMAAMAFLGLVGGGHFSIVAEFAPQYAASISGFVNGIGCTAGIFSPMLAGYLLEDAHASVQQWSRIFYLSSALYALGGIVFLIWASAEIQPWALQEEEPLTARSFVKEREFFLQQSELKKKYGTVL